MKRLLRSGERREFRSAVGRAGRSVTDMFDRLITWFRPERRARFAFPAEIALGAWLALAILLNQQWWGGAVHAGINLLVAGTVGVGVAVHRVKPALALIALASAAFFSLIAIAIIGAGVMPFTYLGAGIIVFGAAAYGSPLVRRIAFVASMAGIIIVFANVVLGAGSFYGWGVGYLLGQGVYFVILSMVVALPWVLGELVRSIRNRRALSATVATVSTQRDAALTRADLEAERTRVARDVHDIVAHSLTVVIAQADGARYATAGDSPAAADAFETIAQTARDALADVRVLLTELRHTQEAGPQPGLADLDALLQSMRESGLTLEVREFGDRGRLTEARELALYRIVQESLTNALRHGDGAATLELEWGEHAVDLVVTNTAGSAASETGERGHGIDGMRERASLAGGELSVHEGAVFRVRARLPLELALTAAASSEPSIEPHESTTETVPA